MKQSTHDGKCNLSTYIALLSFIYSSIQSKVGFWRTSMWRRWRRSARAALTTAEETGGVESGGDLKFWDENETTQGRLLSAGEPLLIVLESGPKQFYFKTAADEGIINGGLKLEPLLIS
jgi:hypothetical protein